MPIPFAAIGAGVGLVTSTMDFFSARKSEKDAEEALKNFRRQELINPYEDIQISRLKSEQQTDANLSNMATSVDALQRTGARGVLAGLPMLNDATTFLQGKISEDLEQQDVNRSMLIAQGEERIRNVREARELGAIQGLGNQVQVGRQDAASATTNFASSLLALGDSGRKNEVSLFADTAGKSAAAAGASAFRGAFDNNMLFPQTDATAGFLNPAFNIDPLTGLKN
tara:strand:+ start:5575 stop:6252 length:678 start_codon:yes stop_codon:yes gene_type:complete